MRAPADAPVYHRKIRLRFDGPVLRDNERERVENRSLSDARELKSIAMVASLSNDDRARFKEETKQLSARLELVSRLNELGEQVFERFEKLGKARAA